MLIINIKSIDPAGWETEREIELEDNEKLLQALLRTVKHYTTIPEAQEKAVEDAAAPAAPAPDEAVDVKSPPVRVGYRGFILAKCKDCGNVSGFNAKYSVSAAYCKSCKTETLLEDMAQAVFHCGNCKKTWTYQTNSQDGSVDNLCIQCGDNLTAWWDKKQRRYETK